MDVVLRTALVGFVTDLPPNLSHLLQSLRVKISISEDNENSVCLKLVPIHFGNFLNLQFKLPESPDYVLNFGSWNGHRLSTVPDRYAY
jgi:hypothetical protein